MTTTTTMTWETIGSQLRYYAPAQITVALVMEAVRALRPASRATTPTCYDYLRCGTKRSTVVDALTREVVATWCAEYPITVRASTAIAAHHRQVLATVRAAALAAIAA